MPQRRRKKHTAPTRDWRSLEALEPRAFLSAAPVITPGSLSVGPATILEGTTLATLTGSYSDTDAGEAHTALIDWGDGTTTAGVTASLGTITVRIDYSYDTNNFFNTQAKKDLLQAAANSIVSHFTDSLLAIVPSGQNTWSQTFKHPATNNDVIVENATIAANEVLIYAGGRDIAGSTLGIGGPGGFGVSGITQLWLDTVSQRGQGTTQGASATDFGPWGGTITFDTAADWWFGGFGDTSGLAGKNDFLSVALHELTHAMGIGTSASWNHFIGGPGNAFFTGPASVAANGANVPLNGDQSHWAEGTTSGGQEVVMDPSIIVGTRKLMTTLDFAGLDDVGWNYVANPNTITGAHTYADNGNYTVSVTVSDPSLTSAAVTTTATATNVAPTLTISTAGPVAEGATLSLTLEHADPGTDTIASWSINWGDGNTEVFNGSSPSPTHVYANPGTFTISATATDEDGTFASNSISQSVTNLAPTLTTVNTLGTATEDADFTITYETLLAASNLADAGGGTVGFRVESVNSGTLTKNGLAVTPGVTTLSTGESLVWHGAVGTFGTVNAFSLRGFDGLLASSTSAVAVNITTTHVNHAPVLNTATSPLALTSTDKFTASASVTVASFAGALISDSDAGALSGIAVTAATGLGTWQYSLNGTDWTGFGAVTSNASLLLSSATFVRYVPDGATTETATFTFRAWDQTSGTASAQGAPATANTTSQGGATAFSTAAAQATLGVTNSNMAPTFTPGANVTVAEDAGAQTVTNWATDIDAGAPGEAAQTLTFIVTQNTNEALFSVAPAIDPETGNLTFTPAPNANGSATLTLTLHDDGGATGGGVDTSAPIEFTITVTAVNDAPTLTVTSNPPAVAKNSPAQSIAGFASVTFGPANESAQALDAYLVTGLSNAALFAVAPALDSSGTLTYTPAAGAHGSATFQLQARDNGGTGPGGIDLSNLVTVKISIGQTFTKTIKLAAIADNDGTLTTFTLGGNGTALVVDEPDGSFSVYATGTDTKSTLTVATKKSTAQGDNSSARLLDVTIQGSLASLTAKTSDLAGAFKSTAGVGAITLRNLIGGSSVNVGPSADPKVALAFSAGRVANAALQSAVPIKSITAFEWLDTGTPETITASRIDSLKIAGDKKTPGVPGAFEAGLTLTGSGDPRKPTLGATTIASAVGDSNWSVVGNAAKISAASFDSGWIAAFTGNVAGLTSTVGNLSGQIDALSIASVTVKADLASATLRLHQVVSGKLTGVGTLTVTGAITHSNILADGSLGSITAKSIDNSRVFAAYGNIDSALPAVLADLSAGMGVIAGLTIKGATGAGASAPSFTNSLVVARTITKVSLKVVDGAAASTFGIASHTLGTYTRTGGTPIPRTHTAPMDYDTLGNFVLRVV